MSYGFDSTGEMVKLSGGMKNHSEEEGQEEDGMRSLVLDWERVLSTNSTYQTRGGRGERLMENFRRIYLLSRELSSGNAVTVVV